MLQTVAFGNLKKLCIRGRLLQDLRLIYRMKEETNSTVTSVNRSCKRVDSKGSRLQDSYCELLYQEFWAILWGLLSSEAVYSYISMKILVLLT
ncbi:hypothetical protein Pfo_028204 [Paulownia fortunei]|nr:hypothetical protein Pfo_028204 [Paulownia fortunei]